MTVALCTPTHSARWLKRLAWSVAAQTEKPESWHLLLNGSVSENEVRAAIVDLKGVRIVLHDAPADLQRTIGALKRHVLMLAAETSNRLIEADHDDVLAATCIEKVVAAFDAGAEFVYSNMARAFDDFRDATLWPPYVTTRKAVIHGREVDEAVASFGPHEMLYAGHAAPNHVRAWTSELYKRLDGHDPLVSQTEDLEFLCRVWLSNPKVAHIDEPLYLHFAHDGDVRDCDKIGEEYIYWINKHVEAMAVEWAKRNSLGVYYDCWPLGRDNSAGVIFITVTDAATEEEMLGEAWNALSHGGFLFVKVSRGWYPDQLMKACQPSLGGWDRKARYQRLKACYDHDDEGVDAILIAQKELTPIAGDSFWNPNVSEYDRHWVERIEKEHGVRVTFDGGRGIVDGDNAEKAAKRLNWFRPFSFLTAREVAECEL